MKNLFLVILVFLLGNLAQVRALGDDEVLAELQRKMTTLEETKNPHALDGEMPVLASRLAEVFHHRYPDVRLLEYEDAKDLLLAQAESMGAAPVYNAGIQQSGETYAMMLQRRLNTITDAPLREATHSLLPMAYFLNQNSNSLQDLIRSSVPMEGTNDSAYYSDLLRDSIAFLDHPPAPPEPTHAAPIVVEPVAIPAEENPEDAELAWAVAESLRLQESVAPPVSSPAPQAQPTPPSTAPRALKPPPPRLPSAASSNAHIDSELAAQLAARRAKIEEAIRPG